MTMRNLIKRFRLPVIVMMLLVGTLNLTFAQGDARARFVHVIPGASAVDVYINGTQAIVNLDYGDATTYLTVPAGTHTVTVTPAGLQTPLWEQGITLAAEEEISYIASSSSALNFEAISDNLDTPSETGTGRLLLVHALSGGPAVNIELTESVEMNNSVTNAGTPLASEMPYGGTYGDYDVPAQVYPVTVISDGGSELIPLVELPVVSGTSHMALVYGTVESPQMLVLSAPTDPGVDEGLVRFVHGVMSAPAVDIFVNDILTVPSLMPAMATEHISLPSGEGTVEVRVAGAEDVIFTGAVAIEPGGAQTVVAFAGTDGVEVASFADDVAAISADNALVSVINTVPGATLDTMSLGTEITLAENLEAGAASDVASVIPTTDTASFTLTRGDNSGSLMSDSQTLYGGVYYNLIVMDGGAFGAPTLFFAPTSLAQTISSAPGDVAIDFSAPAVADTGSEVVNTNTEPTPVAVATETTDVAPQPTPQPTAAPVVVQPPAEDVQVVARVALDPGVNLQLRQYPDADALSLGLAPSGTILTVNGREGAPVALVEGQPPPPEAASFIDPATFLVDDLDDIDEADTWLNVTYTTPDGGEIIAWVSALYVDVRTAAGDQYRLADLETIGRNIPGESVATELSSPPIPEDQVTGTVNNLDAGVNLNIRRTSDASSEVLARVAVGTVLDIEGFNETNDWVYVTFLPAEGGTVTGWASIDYLDLRLNGQITSIPDLQSQFGQYTGAPLYNLIGDDVVGQVTGGTVDVSIPTPDPQEDAIIAEVILDPGSNLQFRRDPDANSESLNLIPTGTRVIVDSRTGDGDWLSVTFEGDTGWVSSQFVSLSFNGQFIDVVDVPVAPGEVDEIGLN